MKLADLFAKRRNLEIALAASIVCAAASAQQPSITPTYTDVVYGPHPLEKMDVYLVGKNQVPPTAPVGAPMKRTPVLVEIHAGGWAGGFKSFFPLYGGLIEEAYARGIAIVSIDYPLAPQDVFPAANVSCQRAIQFIRASAPDWDVDPNRIAVIGCSSGAHLAMWTAMAADAKDAASSDPILHFSSRVAACVAYEGPSDLTSANYVFTTSGGHGTLSPVWQYFGVYTEQDWNNLVPQQAKLDASPLNLVTNGAGPIENAKVHFLAIFGQANPEITDSSQLPKPNNDLHSQLQALVISEALKAAGNQDVQFWFGPTSFTTGQGLLARDAAADWLTSRLRDSKLVNFAYGTPGCYSNQLVEASAAPTVGDSSFKIRTYNAFPNTAGIFVLGHTPLPAETDFFGIGVKIVFSPFDPLLAMVNAVSDADGTASATIPIPNDPTLAGQTFFAQGFWPWTSPQIPLGCSPSPLALSSTNALTVTILP